MDMDVDMDTDIGVEIMEVPEKLKNYMKQYRVIRLANGLKVMLVHDDKVHDDENCCYWPSCALTIAVGSFSDPIDSLGLSQYLGNSFWKTQLVHP